MKKKNISGRIIVYLLLFNIFSTNLISQVRFSVGPDDIQDFLNQIECDFEEQIDLPLSDIAAHLEDLLTESSLDYDAPQAILQFVSPTEASFSWPEVEGASHYHSAFLGLSDGKTESQQSSNPEVVFQDLTSQLGLFTFRSGSPEGSNSILDVIIVDMDIFQDESKRYHCLCYQEPTLLDSEQQCTNHQFFYWSNSCYGNKYYFTVYNTNLTNTYSASFYCIFIDESPIPEVYVLDHCNPDNPDHYGNYFFGEANQFQVAFTNIGIHFYLQNNASQSLTVDGWICDCYAEDDGPTGGPTGDRSSTKFAVGGSSQELAISPNPFSEEFYLSLPMVDGQQVDIVLYDLSGKVVKQLSRTSTEGSLVIPTDDLARGLYQIQVSTATGQSWQQRLLKMD